MRILFVSPEVPSAGGAGIATYIHEATAALAERSHECHVLTWRADIEHARVTREPCYVLHEYPMPRGDDYRFAGLDPDLRIAAAVADWIIDLQRRQPFHIIEGTDWQAPLYCLLQRRNVEPVLNGCRVNVYNHGVSYNICRHENAFTPRSEFQRISLEHQCLNLADAVICPSEAARKALMEMHGVAEERIRVIPEPLGGLPQEKANEAGAKVLLYYGTVSVSKGVQSFLHVANTFAEYQPGCTIEFIGPLRGVSKNEETFKRELVEALAVDPRQVSFTGRLPRQEALQRIHTRHVLINMSKRETYCYAFIEGLLCGATPLALAGSAQAEFIPPHLRAEFTVGDGGRELSGYDPRRMLNAWERHAPEIRDYARRRASPSAYCEAYERMAAVRIRSAVSARETWSKAPVSVLIPAHEPNGYLLETIASARSQHAEADEIVVGDDGSRTPTALAVLGAAAQEPKVRVVNFPWRGLAETRNRLLNECRTPLFAFVDADDLLEPDFIAASRQYLAANYEEGVRSVQGWYELFGTQTGVRGPVIYQHFSHALWNDLKNNILGVTEVFRDLGYNADLAGGEAEDWEFWLRYFRQGWHVRIAPQILWRYRRHAGALSARWSEAMSVGTARANARVFGLAASGSIPPHVWEFIGEYMYLGESFFQRNSVRGDPLPKLKDIKKIETRLSSFNSNGTPVTFRQRTAVRLMRHLARTLQ